MQACMHVCMLVNVAGLRGNGLAKSAGCCMSSTCLAKLGSASLLLAKPSITVMAHHFRGV